MILASGRVNSCFWPQEVKQCFTLGRLENTVYPREPKTLPFGLRARTPVLTLSRRIKTTYFGLLEVKIGGFSASQRSKNRWLDLWELENRCFILRGGRIHLFSSGVT